MLQYPVNIKNPNPKYAQIVLEQYGGPDGELGASLRYLSQRFSMPYPELKGLLTDIGTEELGHLEMIGAIVYQLTRNLTQEQIKQGGFDAYFVNHTTGVYPAGANGVPFNAGAIASKGDVITNLHENMAAMVRLRKNNKAGNPHKHYIFCRTSLFRLRSYKDNFHTKMIKQAIF